MSVYQPKGSPYWHFDFVIKGNRFYGSTGTTSKRDAEEIERAARRKAALGQPDQKRMTLDEACGRYMDEHGKRKKSGKDALQKIDHLLAGLGKNTPLTDLTNSRIAEYIARRRGKVSDASVNRETTYLRAILNRAANVWEVPFKMPNWKAHKLREPRARTRHLTADEEARLFASLRPDFHPLVRFCLLTGARVTSARTLSWASVMADEIALQVKSKFTDDRHTLPITPEVRLILEGERGKHPIFVFTYLCQAKNVKKRQPGKRYPFARDGWRRTWASALRRAKITDFRFHDVRHTAATQMLQATRDITAVKEVLGHKDIHSTMRYAHVLSDAKRRALSRTIPEPDTQAPDKTAISIVKSNG